MLVELWESRPRLAEKKLEDETLVKEVVMNEEGVPVVDTNLRGVTFSIF